MKSRIVGVALLSLAAGLPLAAAPGVKLVAHPSVGGTQIKRADVAAVYLGSMTRWGNGRSVVPVDQSARSAVRAAFSQEVLAKPVDAIQGHWLRQLHAGKVPPLVKTSDADVVAFVRANPGAIGYVSAGAPLDPGVKEVQIVE
jgi:ABC-type phosphate transport system substrate-binding protein